MLYASTSICGHRLTWMGCTVWLRAALPSRGAPAANAAVFRSGPESA